MNEYWRMVLEHDNIAEICARHAYKQVLTSRRYQSATIGCVDLDDLFQEARYALYDAARHYDPDKGASFATYAFHRVRFHLIDVCFPYRKVGRVKNSRIVDKVWTLSELVYPDGETPIELPDPTNYHATVEQEFDIDKDFPMIWRALNERERDVLYRRIVNGHTLKQIADHLGVTESRVSQIIRYEIGKKVEAIFV